MSGPPILVRGVQCRPREFHVVVAGKKRDQKQASRSAQRNAPAWTAMSSPIAHAADLARVGELLPTFINTLQQLSNMSKGAQADNYMELIILHLGVVPSGSAPLLVASESQSTTISVMGAAVPPPSESTALARHTGHQQMTIVFHVTFIYTMTGRRRSSVKRSIETWLKDIPVLTNNKSQLDSMTEAMCSSLKATNFFEIATQLRAPYGGFARPIWSSFAPATLQGADGERLQAYLAQRAQLADGAAGNAAAAAVGTIFGTDVLAPPPRLPAPKRICTRPSAAQEEEPAQELAGVLEEEPRALDLLGPLQELFAQGSTSAGDAEEAAPAQARDLLKLLTNMATTMAELSAELFKFKEAERRRNEVIAI